MRWHAECCRRPAQTRHGSSHCVVADAVKTSLQSSPGTCDHVIGDLLFGQIAGTAGLSIGVRLTQRCGTGADSPIDAKITGQPGHAGLLRPLDGRLGGELAPIACYAHTQLGCDLADSGEVLDRSKMRTAQFMHRGDTLCRRGLQRGARSGSTLLVGKQSVQAAAAEMVGLASQQPVRAIARPPWRHPEVDQEEWTRQPRSGRPPGPGRPRHRQPLDRARFESGATVPATLVHPSRGR